MDYFLDDAKKCVRGCNQHGYGATEENFVMIAKLWSAYVGTDFSPKDVAIMMALMKIAMIKKNNNEYSFVDLVCYAAQAGEIATKGKKKPNCELY